MASLNDPQISVLAAWADALTADPTILLATTVNSQVANIDAKLQDIAAEGEKETTARNEEMTQLRQAKADLLAKLRAPTK